MNVNVADLSQHAQCQDKLGVTAVHDLFLVNGHVKAAVASQKFGKLALKCPVFTLPLGERLGGYFDVWARSCNRFAHGIVSCCKRIAAIKYKTAIPEAQANGKAKSIPIAAVCMIFYKPLSTASCKLAST
jgi:hypothetical protein